MTFGFGCLLWVFGYWFLRWLVLGFIVGGVCGIACGFGFSGFLEVSGFC